MFKKKSFKDGLVTTVSRSPNSVSPTNLLTSPLPNTPPQAPSFQFGNDTTKNQSLQSPKVCEERVINIEDVDHNTAVSICHSEAAAAESCNDKAQSSSTTEVEQIAVVPCRINCEIPLEQVTCPQSPSPHFDNVMYAAWTSAPSGEPEARLFTPFRQSQPPPPPNRVETHRSQSAGSTKSNASSLTSSNADICRICHCEALSDAPLIAPCYCSGSLKYVHQKCLQQWIKSSQTRSCEVCRFSFIMQTKLKPFRKWEKLDISSVERRKILCSVAFHIIAITCVMWSLYVLIDRTAEEIRDSSLEWPFWTKLVVVAIGFTGGLVFMYVQCKMYVQLFRRWRAYNKVICVQNGPSGPSPSGRGNDSSKDAAAHVRNLEQK